MHVPNGKGEAPASPFLLSFLIPVRSEDVLCYGNVIPAHQGKSTDQPYKAQQQKYLGQEQKVGPENDLAALAKQVKNPPALMELQ